MKGKSVLFYTPYANRSRDLESLVLEFHKKGCLVHFISIQKEGPILDFLKSKGIKVLSHYIKNNFFRTVRQCISLITYCNKNNISVVFSHLEDANFIAVLAQLFIKANVIINRHHADDFVLNKWSNSWTYRFTNRYCKRCIVFSEYAKTIMIQEEKIDSAKIDVIKLSYDFSLYPLPDKREADKIRNIYNGDIILISIGRLVRLKKFSHSIELIRQLKSEQINAKLLIIGDGPLRTELRNLISNFHLQNDCILTGRVDNVLDYIAASDILIHPSISESSCVVVKEAGLCQKPVIVCKDVGDFEDYIIDSFNGFLVDKDQFISQAKEIILNYSKNKSSYLETGINLKKVIIKEFSIENNIDAYDKYF